MEQRVHVCYSRRSKANRRYFLHRSIVAMRTAVAYLCNLGDYDVLHEVSYKVSGFKASLRRMKHYLLMSVSNVCLFG